MKNTKTFFMLLIAMLLIIFVAGCTSKDTEKSVNTTDSGNKDTSPDKPLGTPTGDEATNTSDSSSDASATEVSTASPETHLSRIHLSRPIMNDTSLTDSQTASNSVQPNQLKGTVKDLYPDASIDPALENITIVSDNPDVVVERMVMTDNRDYEQSHKWQINAIIRNKGKQSKYIFANFNGVYYGYSNIEVDNKYFNVYGSGDEMNITYDGEKNFAIFDPNSMTLTITSHNVVKPDIDPVFTNLNATIINEGDMFDGSLDKVIDVKSVKCVVKDESKGWKSVVLEVNASDAMMGKYFQINFDDKDGHTIQYDNNQYMYNRYMITGEPNQTVEIPLRSVSPEDIYSIEIYCRS